MAAKGTNKNCCCGGCLEIPVDHGNLAQWGDLEERQQFCCACVPKQICFTYQCPCDMAYGQYLLPVAHPCNPADPATHYSGSILVGGQVVDIELFFQVIDQVCYFCLKSYGLGVTGNEPAAQLLVDDHFRQTFCQTCQDCPEHVYPWPGVQWTISLPGACSCPVTFSAGPVSNTSLVPIPGCGGCPDPCDQPYAQRNPYLDAGCAGSCGGCTCICTCACITVLHKSAITREIACYCEGGYRISNGITISVVPNKSTQCCELHLDPGSIPTTEHPPNVAIGDSTLTNGCPSPTAMWEFHDSSLPFPDNEVRVWFECASCDLACNTVVESCCPAPVPQVLTATVDGGLQCCGAVSFPIAWDSVNSVWTGTLPGQFCQHDVSVTLACTGVGWSIVFDGSPCLEQTASNYAGSCSPMHLQFEVPANGIGCCGTVQGGTLIITITE